MKLNKETRKSLQPLSVQDAFDGSNPLVILAKPNYNLLKEYLSH